MASRTSREPLYIYGPAGVRQFVQTALTVSATTFFQVPLIFSEIYAQEPARTSDFKPASDFFIPPDSSATILETDSMRVVAGHIKHRVHCYGYVMAERDAPGRLDTAKLMAAGVRPGPIYKDIKAATQGNRTLILPDGTELQPGAFVGPPKPGRKVVLLGDTYDPSGVMAAGAGADVLVHEATLPDQWTDRAVSRGHSTPRMAGDVARRMGARNLVLTHFSPRFEERDDESERWPSVDALVDSAASESGGPVIGAKDFMVIDVPPRRHDEALLSVRVSLPPTRDHQTLQQDPIGDVTL